MKDAQKPDHMSLTTVIDRLREGRFVVPDFQREFEWKAADIQKLIRSIFLDYYIGSLLLWKGKEETFRALSSEPIYAHPGDERNREYIVLDGQQRLTAMYYAFFAPDKSLPSRQNRIHFYVRIDRFLAEEYDDAFGYTPVTKRQKELLGTPAMQYEEHVFPLQVMGQDGWSVANWVQGYKDHWMGRSEVAVKGAQDFGEHLRSLMTQYQISYIELDRDIPVQKVCDIFTQINSRGIKLDAFDLMNALLKPMDLPLKERWRAAAPRLEFVRTDRMNVYVLQTMSILRQAYCSPRYLYFLLPGQVKPLRDPDGTRRTEVLVPSVRDFESLWDESLGVLEHSIELLRHPQEYGAIRSSFIPYVTILPVFAALQYEAGKLPGPQRLDAQKKIRKWYWASVFTNRYSSSADSTSARDYLDVCSWFGDEAAEPAVVDEFVSAVPKLKLRAEIKRQSSVYCGLFNLLVLEGARDWMTGKAPHHTDLDDHHIVPQAWGKAHGLGNEIHSILNRTPLMAETNRNVIGSRLPNEYLPKLVEMNGETAVRAVLETHFISSHAQEILMREPFQVSDYDDFLQERERTMREAIGRALDPKLELSPGLRDLDERIERVELGLRDMIEERLEGDPELVPSQVQMKVRELVARERKKAHLEPGRLERLGTLGGQLEFFDLRELQATIVGKSTWGRFESVFHAKPALETKFGQLAELRNAIRHSRSIDSVARKEGEAAVLWFEGVLAGRRIAA